MSDGTSEAAAPMRLELGALLRARRNGLQPVDVGLTPTRGRRNTPGLRREEVARLAGVSVTWYTWLEQGRSITTSIDVIDALARALRLDGDSHEQLRHLAGLPVPSPRASGSRIDPSLDRLLTTVLPAPACLLDLRFDFVGWNQTFATLWDPAGLPPDRRNLIWLTFADQARRERWKAWENRSRILLAEFRAAAGQHAGDPRFTELVDALTVASPEFRSLWSHYEVKRSISGPLAVRLPTGDINFDVIELRVSATPPLTLAVHVPAGPADDKRLAGLTRPSL